MEFAVHNVVLPDGTHTVEGVPPLATERWCRASLATARLLCPPPARVVDLGCEEGGFAVEFVRAGYQVVGIDARAGNIERGRWLRDRLELPGMLRFVHDDVRNLAEHGRFDLAFCSGLLYHLDRPLEFLALLGSLVERLLIVHTHYATEKRNPRFGLSPITVHEGVPGRWYSEGDPGWTVEQWEAASRASWLNDRSFWPLRERIPPMITAAGFPVAYEQFGWGEDDPRCGERFDRAMYVAVREGR